MRRLPAFMVVFVVTIFSLAYAASATVGQSLQDTDRLQRETKVVEKINLHPAIAKLMKGDPRDGRHALHKAKNGTTAYANLRNGQFSALEFLDEKGKELPYEETRGEPENEPAGPWTPTSSGGTDDCPPGKYPCTIIVHNPDGSVTYWSGCC